MQEIINILLSYLIGSISGSMVLGYIKGIDIRKMGSGNAGGTNAFRTVGPVFALGVILIDILKGVVAVLLISKLSFISNLSFFSVEINEVFCAIAAVLGHVYPIYYNFKGGKGAGTLIGIIGVLFPQCIIYALLSWFIILVTTGFVGLGTIIAGVVLSLSAFFLGVNYIYLIFSICMSLFIIFTHRSNIQRMLRGEENRFEKIMFFKKK
jgi:glycerol-3-phosphate acyltransferase PlsY